MKKRIFTGAATAIVTPMNNDGSVNCSKLSELVDWQVNSGIDALVVLGTTGESPTINYQERDEIVQSAVSANKGRVPIIVGAGSNDTARSVNLANLAADCGADGGGDTGCPGTYNDNVKPIDLHVTKPRFRLLQALYAIFEVLSRKKEPLSPESSSFGRFG